MNVARCLCFECVHREGYIVVFRLLSDPLALFVAGLWKQATLCKGLEKVRVRITS